MRFLSIPALFHISSLILQQASLNMIPGQWWKCQRVRGNTQGLFIPTLRTGTQPLLPYSIGDRKITGQIRFRRRENSSTSLVIETAKSYGKECIHGGLKNWVYRANLPDKTISKWAKKINLNYFPLPYLMNSGLRLNIYDPISLISEKKNIPMT